MTSKSSITPELLDQLLPNYEKPDDLMGERAVQAAEEGADRACSGGRTDRAPRLREGRPSRPWQRQQSQWLQRQDDPGRGWRDRDRRSARPRRQLRAAAYPEGADPLRRLR